MAQHQLSRCCCSDVQSGQYLQVHRSPKLESVSASAPSLRHSDCCRLHSCCIRTLAHQHVSNTHIHTYACRSVPEPPAVLASDIGSTFGVEVLPFIIHLCHDRFIVPAFLVDGLVHPWIMITAVLLLWPQQARLLVPKSGSTSARMLYKYRFAQHLLPFVFSYRGRREVSSCYCAL